MSKPKEKIIIQKIKEIIDNKPQKVSAIISAYDKIQGIIESYVDPGYIEAPIVGESEGPEEKEE